MTSSTSYHDFIEAHLAPSEDEPGRILNVLSALQDEYRHIPVEAAYELARITGSSFADICGMISAFEDFDTTPVGEHLIMVCDGTACHTKGSLNIVQAFEKVLGVACDQTTPDNKFTLKTVYCVGACSLAPIVIIDTKSFASVNLKGIDDILSHYQLESSCERP